MSFVRSLANNPFTPGDFTDQDDSLRTDERKAEPNASRNSHPLHRLRMVRRTGTSDLLSTFPSRWLWLTFFVAGRREEAGRPQLAIVEGYAQE